MTDKLDDGEPGQTKPQVVVEYNRENAEIAHSDKANVESDDSNVPTTENEEITEAKCTQASKPVADVAVAVATRETSTDAVEMDAETAVQAKHVVEVNESVREAADEAAVQAPEETVAKAVQEKSTDAVPMETEADEQAEHAVEVSASVRVAIDVAIVPTQADPAVLLTAKRAVVTVEQPSKVAKLASKKPANNTSLGLIAQYASDSSDEETDAAADVIEVLDAESSDEAQVEATATRMLLDQVFQQNSYRDVSSDDDSDTDTDSDVELVGVEEPEVIQITDEGDADYNALYNGLRTGPLADDDGDKPSGPIKAKGEFGLDDLPPIADLTIQIGEDECIPIGHISGIVDTLVLVESLPRFAAVDIDTVMFLDKGNRTLGQVFDVMGVVTSPIYCVRFNKKEDIAAKGISTGDTVYVAPRTEYTNYIVLADLMKQKGCDASWEDDCEPPQGLGEFSNDEEEQEARRNLRHKKRPSQQQRTRTTSECSSASSASQSSAKEQRPAAAKSARNQRRNQQRPQRAPQQQRRGGQAGNGGGGYQFYKDNRDYAAMPNNQVGQYYPPQQFQYGQQYGHSWHTAAAMLQPPPPPQPMAQGNVYPNPFALPYQLPVAGSGASGSAGLLNPHAFPPLPPPMTGMQQHHQPPHHNQHFNRQRQPNFSNHNKNRQNKY